MGIIDGLHPEYLRQDKKTAIDKVGEFVTGLAYRAMDRLIETTEPFIDRSKYESIDNPLERLNLEP